MSEQSQNNSALQAPNSTAPDNALAAETTQLLNSLPGNSDAAGWRRLSSFLPLIRSLLFLVAFAVMVANMFKDTILAHFQPEGASGYWDETSWVTALFEEIPDVSQRFAILGGGMAAIMLLIAGGAFIQWWFTCYRVTESEIELRRGLVFKERRSMPLVKIQGVELKRQLLPRLLGLAAVEVLTAGGNLTLTYISHSDAKILREKLLQLQSVLQRAESASSELTAAQIVHPDAETFGSESLAPAETPSAESLVKIPLKRLIISYFVSWSVLISLCLIAFTVIVLMTLSIDWGQAPVIIFVALIPAVTALIPALFAKINSGWDYHISLTDKEVRISSGLTTKQLASVQLEKINAVQIVQPRLWKFFGWYNLKFVSSGGSELVTGKNYDAVPVGTRAEIAQIFQLIFGERLTADELSMLLERKTPLDYHAQKQAILLGVISAKNESAKIFDKASGKGTLVLRRGFFVNTVTVIALERAQAVIVGDDLIHRILKLKKVTVPTPGLRKEMSILGLSKADSQRLFLSVREELLAIQRSG